jgi:bla regulator protein blaR1
MDAVVSHIWQSTICAAAAGTLAWMLRRNSASARYWIWFAAAMKFLVPFAALSALASRIPWPHSPPVAGGVLEAAGLVFRSSTLPAMSGIASAFVIGVWLSGTFLVLIRAAWQWSRLATHARHSPRVHEGIVHDTLRRLERAEGIRTPTMLIASDQSIEPSVVGIRKPVLIWPQHLTAGLTETHIEAIVGHEMCHIVRRDNMLALIQIIVSAVFWFYPLVWWIGARLVDERERACDERVLARGGRAAIYAESILETCRLCSASPLVSVSGVTGGNLKTRIVRIMRNAPSAPLGVGKKTALVLAALLTAFVPIVGGAASRVATAAPPQDAEREVHRPGGRVVAPKLVRDVKPQYTPRAMQEKIEGEVLLECVVKTDGTVGDKRIVKPLDPDLDQAALDAAAQWLFEPGTRDGKPVDVLVTIGMAFTLK